MLTRFVKLIFQILKLRLILRELLLLLLDPILHLDGISTNGISSFSRSNKWVLFQAQN